MIRAVTADSWSEDRKRRSVVNGGVTIRREVTCRQWRSRTTKVCSDRPHARSLWYGGTRPARGLRAASVASLRLTRRSRFARSGAASAAEPSASCIRARSGCRIRAHARAHAGRHVPLPREVRLLRGRRRGGRAWRTRGRTVFALHPHQDHFRAPSIDRRALPAQVPARRGILAANMETALNGCGTPAAGPADRIVVVGAGVIGLLVAYLCARLPGAEVTIVDIDSSRQSCRFSSDVRFASPDEDGEADVVFHTSGHPAGLTARHVAAGLEASVVEMSWFGEATSLPRSAARSTAAGSSSSLAGGARVALAPAALVLCAAPAPRRLISCATTAGCADHRGCGIQ